MLRAVGRRLVLGLVALLVAMPSVVATAADQPEPSTPAFEGIGSVLEEKAARTPVQQKISSQLLSAVKMQRGEDVEDGVPSVRTGVRVKPDGTTLIDIKAEVTDTILARIEALGGTVINSFPQYRPIRARMPLKQIETLALEPEVEFIRPAEMAITYQPGPSAVGPLES